MTTAAEKVAGISHLLEEILIRVPAKSLARSKLVSKQWLSQISNPKFLQNHSRHRPNKLPTGMFLTDSKSFCDANFFSFNNDLNPIPIPSLEFLYHGIKQLVGDDLSEIELRESCNGLLLCLVTFKSRLPPKYCVCNPTTRKLRLLLPAPVSWGLRDYLAFDPSLSLEYKVICTHFFSARNELYIYSSDNQCWSTFDSPFDPWRKLFFLNGSMYCPESSLRFDVYTEKIQHITTPLTTVNHLSGNDLFLTNSHVYCITKKDAHLLVVLEMDSDFSGWVSRYDDVSLTPLLSPDFITFNLISVVQGAKEDELYLVLVISRKLILYNLKEKTAKELCKFHGEFNWSARGYQFIECLYAV